ncbi:uncharacterized protein EI90DRAFT_3051997, partial [Cantharellus anzutake]|uniref:uncharacterized protein n=1 Tax=Cantharellus anzutake TaxID=1750568 RepID=UPI001905E23B
MALEEAIQRGSQLLANFFRFQSDNDWIKQHLGISRSIVHSVLCEAGDPNIKERLRDELEFDTYIKSGGGQPERELVKLLKNMTDNQVPWSDLFKNEAFLKPKPEITETDITLPTILAWNSTFQGGIANVLLESIADYLSKDRTSYVRLTSIVNSSGTGKSRMVDQLGKEIITVPMCLRPGYEGFPPPDRILRDWLILRTGDWTTIQKRLYGFAYSLLVVTLRKLETIVSERQDIPKLPPLDEASAKKLSKEKSKDYVSLVIDRHRRLASAFREYMTTGQSYHASNPDRKTFYHEVIKLAEKFEKISDENEAEHVLGGSSLRELGEKLCRFIDEHKVLESDKGPQRPLVVLAFDEAHVLSDNPPEQIYWNLFSELRRILRQIEDLPIFSLFLSTAGRLNHPPPGSNERPLNPITEISFDDISYPALKNTVTINRVVETSWISHLGRPLFGSYWDQLPQWRKHEIVVMDYAKQKLLNGPSELRDNPAGALACLSIRFALEFNMDALARDVIYAQVERHMRLCIGATAGFESMITIPGSEPLLAEAAYELLKGTGRNAVRHLANHSDLDCLSRGLRGELVAILLIMQTYDAAREISRRRWVSVFNFMEALLPTLHYETLLQSEPTSWPMGDGTTKHDNTFKALFKDYGMWFNHVIKIESQAMISVSHLWKFVTRGAMILCATNQEGIDIILPVCHTTQNLGPDSVTAIVIQVKNTQDYKTTLNPWLFDTMDDIIKSVLFSTDTSTDSESDSESESTTETPEELAEPKKKKKKLNPRVEVIPVPEKVEPKPVIRVVFALASPEPATILRERPEAVDDFDGFSTFDIWLAGLSCETFEQIQEADLQSYKTLLKRSLTSHDAFEFTHDPNIGEEARRVRGSCARRMAPLNLSEHSHHGIHLLDPEDPGEGSGIDPAFPI